MRNLCPLLPLLGIALGLAPSAFAILDQSFFVKGPSPIGPAQEHASLESQAEEKHPLSLSYSLDVASTTQITHSTSLSVGIGPNLTVLLDGSYQHQGSEPSVYSGDLGFQDRLSEVFSLRLMATGNQTGETSLTFGGSSTLDVMLSALWGGARHTRLQLVGGLAQIWDGPTMDPFGLDQNVYQYTGTVGLYQEIAPLVEVGLAYTFFLQDSQAERDTVAFSLQSQWSPEFSTQYSFSSISQVGKPPSLSFSSALTYTVPSQAWSVGLHGGITPLSSMALGYSGGIDLGLNW